MRVVLLFIAFMLGCTCFAPTHVQAREALSYKHFSAIPVLDNGRIKPLESIARTHLETLYGNDHINGQPAIAWLAQTLFDPATAAENAVFKITQTDLKTRLDLDQTQKFFTLKQLDSGIRKTRDLVIDLLQSDPKKLTKEQTALIQLHENVVTYGLLLRSFSPLLPLNLETPQPGNENPTTYLSLRPQLPEMEEQLKRIIAQKGEDIQTYNADEKRIAQLAFHLNQMQQAGADNNTLQIIPSAWGGDQDNQTWLSPWALLEHGNGSPQTNELLTLWQNAANAYRDQNLNAWETYTRQIQDKTIALSNTPIKPARLSIENLYHNVHPYAWVMGLYGFGIFALAVLPVICAPRFRTKITGLAQSCIAAGIIMQTAAIGARIYILERPPVGTLYESVLFVSLISAIIGMIAAYQTKDKLFSGIGSAIALALLLLAPVMLDNKDSLGVLTAVLNTNFWLATHVICITIGYGVCVLSAGMAHAFLAFKSRKTAPENTERLYAYTHKTALAALLFTAVGTALGGIWADQSWGRFWGWDPKENGALLIVLWLIWAQHGRIAGKLPPIPYVAACAFLTIIVALAWFGVNLLSVGLHSYGFTTGLAAGLAAFCALETLIIGGLTLAA
ncbi:MAG: cytochrome c biogenesis protein, partial [Bdellovibrionales bacterium]